ncbi:MAG: tetratricopeptide repeat protein [Micavibrio sp.]
MGLLSVLKDIKHSQQGDAEAQFNLANKYIALKNHKKAVEWHSKSAIQGHAAAQHMLGLAHIEGKGVPKDYDKAREWLEKSAEQGNIDAQYDLGGLYAQGIGIPPNYDEAQRWWALASSLGHPAATHNLAVLIKKIKSL